MIGLCNHEGAWTQHDHDVQWCGDPEHGGGGRSARSLWIERIVPTRYDMPKLLAKCCDDDWTFEDEVCSDELGACAVHMEWQEPYDVEWACDITPVSAASVPVSQPPAAEMGGSSPATPDEHTGPHSERTSAWFQQHGDPT